MTDEKPQKPKSKKRKILVTSSIVLGSIILLLVIAGVVLICLQQAGDEEPEVYEGSVVDVLREVASAQETYFEKHEKYGTLEHLNAEKLLKAKGIESGKLAGYSYELQLSEDSLDWYIKAWPEMPGKETKSYYIDSTQEIRFVKFEKGTDEKAGPDSPPLWEEEDWGNND
jgi:hypothetical protein